MDVVNSRCAGLDVHKETVVACRLIQEKGVTQAEVRTFGTMTGDLLALLDWLQAGGVETVAMESTGVYWKPVYNILEGQLRVMLVNPQHIKHVPGRKTDVKDAQWIAELLQHGLLKASFIPPQNQRDLLRYRTHLVAERSREANRVQKVLEDANLKLSSVATDILGKSGREMLAAIIDGQTDPSALAQLAKGRLRPKIAELERALQGQVRDIHRLMLTLHLEHIDDLNAKLITLEQEISPRVRPFDVDDLLARLQTIPGVGLNTARTLIAEVGVDMSRFPSARHLASWAGLSPGKNESAGKNRSARINKANPYLRTAFVEAAHGAARSKDNYLAAQYRRLATRRGKKRAAIAVAHSILIIVYHLIQRGTQYIDLGADYFDQCSADAIQKSLVKRLEKLGFQVNLDPVSPPT